MIAKSLKCSTNKTILKRIEMYHDFYNLWQQVISDIYGLPIEICMTFSGPNEPERYLQYVIQKTLDDIHWRTLYKKYFLKMSLQEIAQWEDKTSGYISILLHESLAKLSRSNNIMELCDNDIKLLEKILAAVNLFSEPAMRTMFVNELESAITNAKVLKHKGGN